MILLTSTQPIINVDLTLTFTAIIALSAIISPAIVARINNKHLRKMKEIELSHEEYHETILHKREIFEKFLKSASACSVYKTDETLHEFGTYYPLAYMYFPIDMHNTLIELYMYVMQDNPKEVRVRVELLSSVAHNLMQKEPTLKESILCKWHKRRSK